MMGVIRQGFGIHPIHPLTWPTDYFTSSMAYAFDDGNLDQFFSFGA